MYSAWATPAYMTLSIQTALLLFESHLCRGGFPHSDIPGSKLVCQLPGAFRRLPRPSSPVIAKASTTCTYSLDPITLSPQGSLPEVSPLQAFTSALGCRPISQCQDEATIQSSKPSRSSVVPAPRDTPSPHGSRTT